VVGRGGGHFSAGSLVSQSFYSLLSGKMLSTQVVVGLWLTLLGVMTLGFVVLYRTLVRIERRMSSSSTSVPVATTTSSEMRTFLVLAALVAALGILGAVIPDSPLMHALYERIGLGLSDPRPLEVWMPPMKLDVSDAVRYQWHAFDLENKTRLPVIECAQYMFTLDLQESLLSSLPELPTHRGVVDPSIERQSREASLILERHRATARRRCVLNPPNEHVVLDARTMDYLTNPRQASIVEALATYAKQHDIQNLGPTNHVLMARNGSRFYSLLMVVPNNTRTHPNPLRVEHRLMSEEALLQAPATYFQRFCSNPAYRAVDPCICPAHFGVFNSELHFYYERSTDTSGRTCGKWHLWSRARVVRGNVGSTYQTYEMNYLNETSPAFPHDMLTKFEVPGFAFHEMTTVEYVDLEALLQTVHGLTLLDLADRDWLASSPMTLDQWSAPLLSVLSLDDFRRKGGDGETTLRSEDSICFGYCRHLDATVLRLAQLNV
jgi:hypothetical protein